MGSNSSLSTSFLLFLSSFLLFSSATQAFNITRLLGQFPEFSTFNSFLTQTNVSVGVNRRQTITVLAVENGAVSSLSGKPVEDLKNIMRLHVILDYYDLAKLNNLEKGTALLTTMFQASGQATGQQGFLNVTAMDTGEIKFGSAVKGSPLNAKLVKKVAAQPFNISVLQISTPIMAPGVEGGKVSPPVSAPPAPAPGPPKATTPSPAPAAESPKEGEAPAPSEAPAADAPAADAPAADAPAADAPAADAPVSSPPMPADGPVADTSRTADAPSKASGAAEVSLGLASCIAVASGLAATLLAL